MNIPSPAQPRKALAHVVAIVERISFLDRTFHVEEKGDGFLLQVRYPEPDIETGKVEEQRSRKWYVSAFSTESEIVETAHGAVLRSMAHVVGEHFLYRGRRVYSPHFEIGARVELCDGGRFDGRIPPPASTTTASETSRDDAMACDECGAFHGLTACPTKAPDHDPDATVVPS